MPTDDPTPPLSRRPSAADRKAAARSAERLGGRLARRLADRPRDRATLRMRIEDDEDPIELPAAAADLLVRMLEHLARGEGVGVLPVETELTTQQVADLLGVSRPFVVKEIEAGRLSARMVGTHRRVGYGDLLAYRMRRDGERRRALDELAALDEELGLD